VSVDGIQIKADKIGQNLPATINETRASPYVITQAHVEKVENAGMKAISFNYAKNRPQIKKSPTN